MKRMDKEPTVELNRAEIMRVIGNPVGLFYEGCECPVCVGLREKLAPFTLAGILDSRRANHSATGEAQE